VVEVGSLSVVVEDLGEVLLEGAAVVSIIQPDGQAVLSGLTIADGSISFNDVIPGVYSFQASLGGYLANTGSVTIIPDDTVTLTLNMEKEENINDSIGMILIVFSGGLLAVVFYLWRFKLK